MPKTISILGTGWLGLPLAKALLSSGFVIKGSVRKTEKIHSLENLGIKPYLLELSPNLLGENIEDFFNTSILIIAIPPQITQKGEMFHILQIQHLIEYIKPFTDLKIIYTSSTSVYPMTNDWVDEKSTEALLLDKERFSEVNYTLLDAESILQNSFPNTTILRLAGLMGKGRMLGKYFAGKTLDTGDIPINWVHQSDVIQVIKKILEKEIWGEIFNVVATEHPTKKEVYSRLAQDFQLEMPIFVTPQQKYAFKIVSNQKLLQALNLELQYTNPLNFRYD